MWPFFVNELSHHLPLTNVMPQSGSSAAIRPLPMVQLAFVPFTTNGNGGAHIFPPRDVLKAHREVHVHLFVIAPDDIETYKTVHRAKISSWVDAILAGGSRRNQHLVIVHVSLKTITASERGSPVKTNSGSPATSPAGRGPRPHRGGQTPTGTPSSSASPFPTQSPDDFIYERIQSNFGDTSPARPNACSLAIVNVSLTSQDATYQGSQWRAALSAISDAVYASFHTQRCALEEEAARTLAQMAMPGWNYGAYFIQRESLALLLGAVGLLDDALGHYDDLESIYEKFNEAASLSQTVRSSLQLNAPSSKEDTLLAASLSESLTLVDVQSGTVKIPSLSNARLDPLMQEGLRQPQVEANDYTVPMAWITLAGQIDPHLISNLLEAQSEENATIRRSILQGNVSMLTFASYLFSRQYRLLCDRKRAIEAMQRAKAAICTFCHIPGNATDGHLISDEARARWAFYFALRTIPDDKTDHVPISDSHQRRRFLAARSQLCILALQQLNRYISRVIPRLQDRNGYTSLAMLSIEEDSIGDLTGTGCSQVAHTSSYDIRANDIWEQALSDASTFYTLSTDLLRMALEGSSYHHQTDGNETHPSLKEHTIPSRNGPISAFGTGYLLVEGATLNLLFGLFQKSLEALDEAITRKAFISWPLLLWRLFERRATCHLALGSTKKALDDAIMGWRLATSISSDSILSSAIHMFKRAADLLAKAPLQVDLEPFFSVRIEETLEGDSEIPITDKIALIIDWKCSKDLAIDLITLTIASDRKDFSFTSSSHTTLKYPSTRVVLSCSVSQRRPPPPLYT